jgi:GT2 family glycosyltransferase
MLLLDSILVACAIPALLVTGYLALLAACSGRRPGLPPSSTKLRFDIVVPAHDEESGIARTVCSLRSLRWPEDRFRVVVVADNCRDGTAGAAAAAGASVIVRHDPERRGKGFALDHAFDRLTAEGRADAVVVVDADTVVHPDLLRAFAARIEGDAQAVQARYAVLNPGTSWRTRLMAIAFATFHDVRSLGRERLGVSCGLRGNGMCFTIQALRAVPHGAFSIVEDVEYGLSLGEAGIRVHYAHDASVFGEMVSAGSASRSQRLRWEEGRRMLAREHARRLLALAGRRRDRVLLDLGLDLLVPPFSRIAAYTVAGTIAAAVATASEAARFAPLAWAAACACALVYVLRGVQLSGAGLRGLVDLAFAPLYVAWKGALLLSRGRARGEWIRTRREPAHGRSAASTPPGDPLYHPSDEQRTETTSP